MEDTHDSINLHKLSFDNLDWSETGIWEHIEKGTFSFNLNLQCSTSDILSQHQSTVLTSQIKERYRDFETCNEMNLIYKLVLNTLYNLLKDFNMVEQLFEPIADKYSLYNIDNVISLLVYIKEFYAFRQKISEVLVVILRRRVSEELVDWGRRRQGS